MGLWILIIFQPLPSALTVFSISLLVNFILSVAQANTCELSLYTQDYWSGADAIKVTINTSKLVMPNAFSPNNGDTYNNTYRPKEYESLVEFHATIYNRWGQKLYEWHDPAEEGWDGTYNGKDVKQGVYFVEVVAKGADGHRYHIRRDVNLLRGYRETEGGGGGTSTTNP